MTELHSEVRHSPYVSLCPIIINPFNAELNPICHLLVLLVAHHILHVSRIRVKPVVMRWGRHGAPPVDKNIPTSMRDICTKYDTFKRQAYKEHYIKIQLGEMGYKNND